MAASIHPSAEAPGAETAAPHAAAAAPHTAVHAAVSPTCLAGQADRLGLAGRVEQVCVVNALAPDLEGKVGVTAIDKRPVDDAVMVRTLGLHADIQADRKNHGGEHKAVYAYATEDARWWSEQLGREIPPGRFGENLRISGFDVDGALIGERWTVGERLVLEVSGPRIPCATFGRWLGEPQWVRRFLEAGRPGTYFTVVTPGLVRAGDEVTVTSVPDAPTGTVREAALSRARVS